MGEERQFRPCCPNPFGCIGEDGCCTQPFVNNVITIERRASQVRRCGWNTCGYQDPEIGGCDKTYYDTEKVVTNYANGSVKTTIRTRNLDENSNCVQTVTSECEEFESEYGPLPCSGLGTSETTYSGEVLNPISEYDNGPCQNENYTFRPYRYQGPSTPNGIPTYWQDICFTNPYPTHNSDGTFSDEEYYPPWWSFVTEAVDLDLTSNRCQFSFYERSQKINLKYRIRHYAPATCYLKVWMRVSTQKQKLVESQPPSCCKNLVSDGEPTREIVSYTWRGSGRPCFDIVSKEDGSIDYQACESVIYSEDYDLIAEPDTIKTVSLWKWSFVDGYEPNNPDTPPEIAEVLGGGYQGRYPNGFPIWPWTGDGFSQERW